MRSLLLTVFCLFALLISNAQDYTLKSPDGHLSVSFSLSPEGKPLYAVFSQQVQVLEPSALGVVRDDEDLSRSLQLQKASAITSVTDQYTMLHGKKKYHVYKANKRTFSLRSAKGTVMEVIFQVSNDGVAFRYHFPGSSVKPVEIREEVTSFNFPSSARAFLQPCMDSKTGWNKTQPSYEEHYQQDIAVGTAAPQDAGWVLPALFKTGDHWLSITEAGMDGTYCGVRLGRYSPNGEYRIQFPAVTEGYPGEAVLPTHTGPLFTPWRIIALSNRLSVLATSTLGTDLAAPAKYDVSKWLKPGKASWSWIMLKDGSITYDIQKQYIDMAAAMKWQYCLVDVNWDRRIGYEKMANLARYADSQQVKLILWYNSAGDWNTVDFYTPRNKMLTKASRVAEFTKLKEMGIAGIKVDFFGGDGQSMMKYYTDILEDAAKYEISVNFHGSTYPRGWARTYPNLVTMEAIKGEEFITFNQADADMQPTHCAMLPFTRNLFDPMDFTPVNLSGIRGIKRRTTGGFEMALSVLFLSGIQHYAESAQGIQKQADFTRKFLQDLPDTWDETHFIDGYPGKFVVLARRSGKVWYIAGIHAEAGNRTLSYPLSLLPKGLGKKAMLITDNADGSALEQRNIDLSKGLNFSLLTNGGFVMRVE